MEIGIYLLSSVFKVDSVIQSSASQLYMNI